MSRKMRSCLTRDAIRDVIDTYDEIEHTKTVTTSIDQLPGGIYSVTFSSKPKASLIEMFNGKLPLAEDVSSVTLHGGQYQVEFVGSPYMNPVLRFVHRKWNDCTRLSMRSPTMLLKFGVFFVCIALLFFVMVTWALQTLYDTWLRPY